ncbi:endoglucanase A precursor [Byssothecium circinans]|uniref:Endoglucanase A n=1 Tax=Byssothecium circinans TaxID=147558 RepID=A0A6A5TTH8_9PLEO|nr:endoglucanase A precursor [Byssothecium circinans]
MKFSTVFTLASTAAIALATPTPTIQKRADFCGTWDSATTGVYTVYNNLWGQGSASSGSQCTGVDGLSGSTLKWHTKWSWAGGQGQVKSYANVVTKVSLKALSAISTIPTTWTWSYSGSDIVGNVAYDIFTSASGSGSSEYEIMIWLAALGGAGPISATGSPIATVTLAGKSWKLYYGLNGSMKVYSFVASSQINSFNGNLMEFANYVTSKQGMPKSQVLQSVGAGTEPFSGSNAVLTTTAYTLSLT